jgi:hypothetical protein
VILVEREYTVDELAELTKQNIEVVRRKLRRGDYKGIKRGKDWRILESEVNRIQKEGG